ncbi:hypothetical protein BH11MYX2_BH11MYX2_35130 [soil metagenome]
MNAISPDAERTAVDSNDARVPRHALLAYLEKHVTSFGSQQDEHSPRGWPVAASTTDAFRTAVVAVVDRGDDRLFLYVAKNMIQAFVSVISLDAFTTTAHWPSLPPTASPRALLSPAIARPRSEGPSRADLLALARAAVARRAQRADSAESVEAWAEALANGVADRND